MSSNNFVTQLGVPRLSAIILFMCLATVAAGQTAYTLETPAGPVEMVPQIRDISGVRYAAVAPFIEAAAGGQRIAGNTAQIDLRGATAWVDDGRNRVSGSRGNITLTHPPRIVDGALWIGVADLVVFFESSFNVRWSPVALAPAPEEIVPEEAEEAMPEDLLTPFDLDDAVPPTPVAPVAPVETAYSVVIDPGHGGTDKGATGASGITESGLALSVSQALEKLATPESGFVAHLTRSDDRLLSYTERVRIVQESNAKLVVSIHAGDALTPTVSGYAIMYASGAGPGDPRTVASQAAATVLAEALTKETGREVIAIRGMPLRVSHSADTPTVLIVIGSLNNPADERFLTDEANQARVAAGLAQGLNALASKRSL